MVNLLHRLPVSLTLHRQRVGGNLSLITYHLSFTRNYGKNSNNRRKEYPVQIQYDTLIAFEQTSDKSFLEKTSTSYSRVILVFAAMFAADEKSPPKYC